MLPGPGSTSGNVDSAANKRPRHKFRRLKEKMNPHNIQFQRQVAAVQARQQERDQMFAILNLSPVDLYLALSVLSHETEEDGLSQVSSQSAAIVDSLEPSASSSSIFIRVTIPEESHRRCLIDSSRTSEAQSPVPHKVPDSDFLDHTFKTSANAKQATRNKNKRKNKKKKRRHCRKEPCTSEMHENHEADVPLVATPSPRTPPNEISMERPDCEIGWSRPSTNEMELHRPATSYFQFCEQSSGSNYKWLESSMNGRYTDSSWNFSVGIENLLICKNEFPCASSKLADSGGFKSGGGKSWINKSSSGKSVCLKNGTGACSDYSDDDDFQLVISRKRAQKLKKMQHLGHSSVRMASSSRRSNVCKQPQHGTTLKDFIKDLTHKSSRSQPRVPREFTLQDYITGIDTTCLTGPRENCGGKSLKGPNLIEVATKSGLTEDNNDGSAKMLQGTVHPGKSDDGQMAPRSASHVVVQKDMDDNCTSGHRPTQDGEVKVLLSGDGDAIYKDSRSPSPAMTLSLDYLDISSCVEQKGQNKENKVERSVYKKHRRTRSDQHAEAADSLSHADAADQWKSPTTSEADLDDVSLVLPTVQGNKSSNKQIVGRFAFDLTEIVKAANDAYRIQVASDDQLISGYPIADIETFIFSATPVIGQISCIRCGKCLQDRPVSESPCQYQLSNVYLRSIWQWYEEPGSFGLNVEVNNNLSSTKLTCSASELSANFVPSLSAIQLFGQSRKSLDGMIDNEEASLFKRDHAELLFEYFESERPSSRRPLLEKIKHLVSDANISGSQVFGDPKELENVKLSDLHPASWFCVAWYPIYRIPRGNCHAAFLTYHSLGKFVRRTCSPDMPDGRSHLVFPVVGLWSYNDKGEHWFQLRDAGLKTMSSDDTSKTDRAEVLKERLTTLWHGASVISRAVIPKATGETMNHHPDYEFFRSRSN